MKKDRDTIMGALADKDFTPEGLKIFLKEWRAKEQEEKAKKLKRVKLREDSFTQSEECVCLFIDLKDCIKFSVAENLLDGHGVTEVLSPGYLLDIPLPSLKNKVLLDLAEVWLEKEGFSIHRNEERGTLIIFHSGIAQQ